MFSIAREAVPEDSLLKTHRGAVRPERWGNYGDCFSVRVDRAASLADFVFAFYTYRRCFELSGCCFEYWPAHPPAMATPMRWLKARQGSSPFGTPASGRTRNG